MLDLVRKDRIIECHNNIHNSMKAALDYALEAGQLLTEQKEELTHGEFLPWLKENMPFGVTTAWKYVGLYKHSDKISSSENLQEAYRQIETIEAQEKRTEEQKQKQRINSYLENGVKPAGWRRGTDDKIAEELKQKKERDREFFEKIKQEKPDKKTVRESVSELNDFMDRLSSQQERKEAITKSLRLTGDNAEHEFNQVLIEYLDSLDTDSMRLEACHNIIKICKRYVSMYQTGAARGLV